MNFIRHFFRVMATALIAVATTLPTVEAQVPVLNRGMGPVVAGSFNPNKLPKRALKFLQDFYGNHFVRDCEKEFMTGNYDLTMTDGTEIEFDSDGRVVEISATDDATLPEAAVKHIVPRKVYRMLDKMGALSRIESIDTTRRGYDIEFADGYRLDEIYVSLDGHILAKK